MDSVTQALRLSKRWWGESRYGLLSLSLTRTHEAGRTTPDVATPPRGPRVRSHHPGNLRRPTKTLAAPKYTRRHGPHTRLEQHWWRLCRSCRGHVPGGDRHADLWPDPNPGHGGDKLRCTSGSDRLPLSIHAGCYVPRRPSPTRQDHGVATSLLKFNRYKKIGP
jgi:hypothetical protein